MYYSVGTVEIGNEGNCMKKVGLCLSGGGARGAYQIGAIKALQDLGLYDDIKYISGTSIGAANAALISTNEIDTIEQIWKHIPENPIGDDKTMLQSLKENKLNSLEKGLFKMDKLDPILFDNIDFNALKQKDVFVTVSDSGSTSRSLIGLMKSSVKHYLLNDKQANYISLKELDKDMAVSAIKASCSIPVVFSPITMEKTSFYDGGVFDNTPITPLVDAGCNEIILINISAIHSNMKQHLKSGVILHEIKSNQKLGGVLDFTNEHSEELLQRGYDDTLSYFTKYTM